MKNLEKQKDEHRVKFKLTGTDEQTALKELEETFYLRAMEIGKLGARCTIMTWPSPDDPGAIGVFRRDSRERKQHIEQEDVDSIVNKLKDRDYEEKEPKVKDILKSKHLPDNNKEQ